MNDEFHLHTITLCNYYNISKSDLDIHLFILSLFANEDQISIVNVINRLIQSYNKAK